MALTDDIISYYKLDETSGTTVEDSAGDNDGTNNGATVNQTGKISKAYSFDGTNDYVDLGFKVSTTEGFSVNVWFKSSTTGTIKDLVSSWGGGGAGNASFHINTDSSNNVNFATYNGSSGYQVTTSGTNYCDGNWYMATLVFSGTSGVGTLYGYINGTEINDASAQVQNSTNYNTYLGAESTGVNYLNGNLDEVGIWSRALSSEEVTSLYNSGNGLTYPFTTGPTVTTKDILDNVSLAETITIQTDLQRIYTLEFTDNIVISEEIILPSTITVTTLNITDNVGISEDFGVGRQFNDFLNISEIIDVQRFIPAIGENLSCRTFINGIEYDLRRCNISRSVGDYIATSNFSLELDSPFGLYANKFNVSDDVEVFAGQSFSNYEGENFNTVNAASEIISDFPGVERALAQTFTVGATTENIDFNLAQASVKLFKENGANGEIYLSIQNLVGGVPDGTDLTQGAIHVSSINKTTLSSAEFVSANFNNSINLHAGSSYALIMKGVQNNENSIQSIYSPTGGYTGGNSLVSLDGGINWINVPSRDYPFKLYSPRAYIPKKFKGKIEKVSFNGTENTQKVTLTGRDLSQLLQDTTVEPIVYTNTEISSIIKSIVENNIVGITTNNVNNTGIILSRIAFNHTSVFDAIQQLAELAEFSFYVDINSDLHFEQKQTNDSGITIDNTNIIKTTFNTTREDMFNDIWVYGDRTLAGFQETLNANGGSVFNLLNNPHNTYVEYNGIPQRGGVYQMVTNPISGTNYLISYNDKQLIFTSGTDIGNSVPISGGSIVVNYDRSIPIVKQGTDRNSQQMYGKKTKIINDKSIKDPLTAKAILDSQLENSTPFKGIEANLYGWYDFNPGDTLNVELDDLGIKESNISLLNVDYDFNEKSVQNNQVIKVRLNKKIKDVTDSLKDIKSRLDTLEASDRTSADLITRFETSSESVQVIGSNWSIATRDINDTFILGHPVNGVLGVVNPSKIGTISGTGVAWVSGIGTGYDKALYFNGSSLTTNQVRCPIESTLINSDNFTASCWYYCLGSSIASSPTNLIQYILGKYAGGAPQWGIRATVTGSINIIYRTSTQSITTALEPLELNRWYHIAQVVNIGSSRQYGYVNGSGRGNDAFTPGSITNVEYLHLGKSDSTSSTTAQPVNGYIDEVRIYNYPLTPSEIGSLAEKKNYPINGLISYYKMDEGAGSYIYSSTTGSTFQLQPLLGDRRGELKIVASGIGN